MSTSSPETLPAPAALEPRAGDDAVARARVAARILDRLVGIPGSDLGIGLDAIVGALLPGVGDLLGGAVSLYIVWQGVRARVPAVVVARMLVNLGLDALTGVVPLLGDLVDVVNQANLRNLHLIERHQGGAATTGGDWLVVSLSVAFLVACFAAQFVAIALLAGFVRRWLG